MSIMDSLQVKIWIKSLDVDKSILPILYEIFGHFKANPTACTSNAELILAKIRQILEADHDPVTSHLAHQVIYQILYLLDRFETPTSSSSCYGMLHSNTDYYLRFATADLQARCLADLEQTTRVSSHNCRTLVYSLLNVIKVIDLFGYDPAMSKRLWPIIELHLETPIGRVRELLMQIFGHVASDRDFLGVLVPSISQNLSWLNRNKYEMLATLASKCATAVDPELFFEGLTQSLQFRKLMRGSQKLVRELRQQPSTNQRLTSIVVDVLKHGSDLEVQNLAMFWSTSLDLDALYTNLGLASMTIDDLSHSPEFEYIRKQNFQTLIIVRHMLAPTAFARHAQISEIDSIVVRSGSEHQNHHIRQLVCDILVKSPRQLENVISFLTLNANVEDAALRNFVVIKVKQLLQLLYKKRAKEDARKLSSIFRDGAFERYQEMITRLLILEAFLDRTKGVAGLYELLEFKPDDVEVFRGWLNVLIPSMVTSKFDDIRETMLRLSFRYLMEEKLTIFTPDQVKQKCLELAKSKDLDCVACCHQYARIFRHFKFDVVPFWEDLSGNLHKSSQQFSKDPFLAAQQGHNLFGLINCLTELAVVVMDHSILKNLSLMCEISAKNMLKHLNSKDNKSEKQRPTFERMEQSLCKLLGVTMGEITDRWQDEQTLLKSIWLTLKACCELSANLAERGISTSEQIMLHKTVLLGCCHKGVIEAAGVTLGRIVHKFSAAGQLNFDLVKNELIDEIVRTKSDDCLELRSTRGLCIMLHQLVKNDFSNRQTLFYYCLTKLLPLASTSAKDISFLTGDDLKKFYTSCQPLQLALLTALVKDGSLAERMFPFMDLVLQLTFEMFKSPLWTMRNSAAQLLAAASSKLAQQKLCFEGVADEEVTPIAIAYCDIFTKYPDLWAYIALNVGLNPTLDMMLLKFLSLFEYRDIGRGGNARYRDLYDKIAAKCYRNSQITKQLRKFEANFEVSAELPAKVAKFIDALFAKGVDYDAIMSLLDGIVFCLQRYEVNHSHLDKMQLFVPFRDLLVQRSLDDFVASPYWLQLKLLDTLLYLGLGKKDAVFASFVNADRSRFVRPVEIGKDVWLRKVSDIS